MHTTGFAAQWRVSHARMGPVSGDHPEKYSCCPAEKQESQKMRWEDTTHKTNMHTAHTTSSEENVILTLIPLSPFHHYFISKLSCIPCSPDSGRERVLHFFYLLAVQENHLSQKLQENGERPCMKLIGPSSTREISISPSCGHQYCLEEGSVAAGCGSHTVSASPCSSSPKGEGKHRRLCALRH